MAALVSPAADTIPGVAAAAAESFSDQLAVVDGNSRLSYGELIEAASGFGAALVASGVGPGERVAVWGFNSAEWIVALLGTLSAGATLVPVNTRFKGAEATDVLGRTGARVLVTVTDFLGLDYVGMLRATGARLEQLQTIVVFRGRAPEGTVQWGDFVQRGDAEALRELERRTAALSSEDPADILFTSGTTGRPKGVVMTHGRTLRVATDWVQMTGLSGRDRYLMVNPYFHMFGLKGGILACLAAGATMLPEATLDVERVLARVENEKVTVLPGPPTLYQSILDHPEVGGYDLSSLRVAVTGSADIPVELIRRIHDELPFSIVVSGYGLTEGGTATSTGPEDEFEAIASTVGRPRPGFEVRVVGEGNEDAPPGQPGEIWVRGRSVMSHYLDDPDATADVLTTDGWLRTGDLGSFDAAGRLRIVGRLKDMFIVGGFNAYPAEIENLLMGHPDICQAAVIGVPDHRLGEVGMAFVVCRPGSSLTADQVVAWSRDHMANYKVPRRVEIVADLPLTATGKVHKDVLRTRAAKPVQSPLAHY